MRPQGRGVAVRNRRPLTSIVQLLKMSIPPGQEREYALMILECCSQERTYLKYYGLMGQR